MCVCVCIACTDDGRSVKRQRTDGGAPGPVLSTGGAATTSHTSGGVGATHTHTLAPPHSSASSSQLMGLGNVTSTAGNGPMRDKTAVSSGARTKPAGYVCVCACVCVPRHGPGFSAWYAHLCSGLLVCVRRREAFVVLICVYVCVCVCVCLCVITGVLSVVQVVGSYRCRRLLNT